MLALSLYSSLAAEEQRLFLINVSEERHSHLMYLPRICQVFMEGRLHHILDGLNEQRSNWMRYVNPAHTVEEQNLVACQNGLEIYFYTIKALQPGQELLVWYCQELAQRCNYPPLGQLSVDGTGRFTCSFAFIKSKLQIGVSGQLRLPGSI